MIDIIFINIKPTKHIGKVRRITVQSFENKEIAKTNTIENCLKEVRSILKDLKYGTITIVVQDGIPIQLDTTEKKRFK